MFCIFYLFFISSCSNRRTTLESIEKVKPYPHIVRLGEGLNNEVQIKLSDIADSIRYVVLSKDKEVIIGSFRRLQLTDRDIYINSDGLIMRFDISGRFLNSFGHTGRGPEEYLPGSPYSLTTDNKQIVISKGIVPDYLYFKPDGQYIGKKVLPYSRNMFDFIFVSDSSMLITYYFIGRFMNRDYLNAMPWLAGLFNFDGKPLGVIENPLINTTISDPDLKRVILTNPVFTQFDNRVVLAPEGDTIYEIDKSSKFPGFIMDWGHLPHQQTPDELYLRQTGSTNKVTISGSLLETNTKAFFRVAGPDGYRIFQYNKITGAAGSMKEDKYNMGFINDLDGGINFYPYWTNREGNIWIGYEDAFTFIEKHNEEFLSGSVAAFPEMKEKLKFYLNGLKPDDNPVLKIVFLKRKIQ